MDIRAVLAIPEIYRLFNKIIASGNSRESFVAKYMMPEAGRRILDIGCGTADILDYLPAVEYPGIDKGKKY